MFGLFNLFRRTKVENWELELLANVFSRLPNDYSAYEKQIEMGLVKGVLLSDHPFPNYVNFTYDPKIAKSFEDRNGRFFCLKGIEVFDKSLNTWSNLEIYMISGLVCGYCTPTSGKFRPDTDMIRLTGFRKVYLDGYELETMREFLDQSEIDLINPSEFYEVPLEGKTYYHVTDLEDGDFIGLDREKNVYRITHDPYEIKLLEGGIHKNLSKY